MSDDPVRESRVLTVHVFDVCLLVSIGSMLSASASHPPSTCSNIHQGERRYKPLLELEERIPPNILLRLSHIIVRYRRDLLCNPTQPRLPSPALHATHHGPTQQFRRMSLVRLVPLERDLGHQSVRLSGTRCTIHYLTSAKSTHEARLGCQRIVEERHDDEREQGRRGPFSPGGDALFLGPGIGDGGGDGCGSL